MSRDECKQGELKKQWPDVQWMLGDIRDYHACRNAVRGADYVIHAASLKYVDLSEQQPSEYIQTNVVGTMALINAVIDQGTVRHVVGISTDKAANAFNAYGLTKALLEKVFVEAHMSLRRPRGVLTYPTKMSPEAAQSLKDSWKSAAPGIAEHPAVLEEGLKFEHPKVETIFNVCRYGNVIGSRGSVVLKWQELARAGKPIQVTDPSMTRFFFTVKDAVDLIARALNLPGGVIVSQAMPATTLGELALLFGDYDRPIGRRPGEKQHEDLLSEHEMPRVVRVGDSFFYEPLMEPSRERWAGSEFERGYTSFVARRLSTAELRNLTAEWRSGAAK